MIPSSAVYLLRHGETVWNREKRLQGHKDTPLTLRGVEQARAMGHQLKKTLRGIKPQYFFSSPIGRAYQTAVIIADSINFNTDTIATGNKLKEITFGDWDGLNMEEIIADYQDIWEKRNNSKWHFSPPNGESYATANERVKEFLDHLPKERPIIIVAHGSLNKVIRGCWRNLTPEDLFQLDEPQDGFYLLEANSKESFISA
jgi:probable phosphoglycerate mutase